MSSVESMTPEELVVLDPNELWAIPRAEVEAFQLHAAQDRFAALRSSVELLGSLSAIQKTDGFEKLDDIVPVLFSHATYKSYPISLVERGDFVRLTQWLGTLTAHPMSEVDASKASTIDEWVDALDDQSPVRLVTSSGTSGKLTFFPRSLEEMNSSQAAYRARYLPFRAEPGVDVFAEPLPVVNFGYERGRSTVGRRLETLSLRDPSLPSRYYAMYRGRMTLDLLALAGRLTGAAQRGEAPEATIHPSLLNRRDELKEAFASRRSSVVEFVQRLDGELRGVQVLTLGGMAPILDAALAAEDLGIAALFRPDSIATAGGGLKGRPNTPEDYRERIKAFLGVSRFYDAYGMSEQTAVSPMCPVGYYHILPYVVPFAVDPDTGRSLGREGTTTGRFACLDLLARTYWGGLITGDRVTILWDGECDCGRTGARIERNIIRYSELTGGEDKITCAGTPDAYDRAIEYVVNAL